MEKFKIVVMGVSGCGKSLIGSQLAKALQINFFDGDDYHPEFNIQKMSQGMPLNDDDRDEWLNTLNTLINEQQQAVIACSALTPKYRAILKKGAPNLQFVYLKGDFDTIWQRHQKRENHYFNGQTMLKNQFDTLIEPSSTEALIVDIRQSVEQIVADIQAQLSVAAILSTGNSKTNNE
ncbi:MAG: gluconokinase [Moritella sp.]|uniref:gluconokinase n=1 Tax=Moritella sp. TaxID=78556 RepID=UPI0029A06A59|nr:gluconokinase [Moritella sp.]MDX2321921.1 gluconokinase [Moritella sp.]